MTGGLIGIVLLLLLFLPSLVGPNLFMPHAHCYLGRADVMWLHGGSDLMIGLAYMAISITLFVLVRRVNAELPFGWMVASFGLFIIACGLTHFLNVWTLWNPSYWLSGSVKGLTALASVVTAVALPPTIPKIIRTLRDARSSEERRLELEELYVKVEAFRREREELLARLDNGPEDQAARGETSTQDGDLAEQSRMLDDTMGDLRSLQSRFDILWKSNVLAMGVSHLDGRISDANDRFLEIIGYDRQSLERGDINFHAITPEGGQSATRSAVSTARDTGVVAPFEKAYQTASGEIVPVLVGAARIEGTEDANLFFALDLTETKRAEEKIRTINVELERRVEQRTAELQQANRDLQSFSYSVSHDLRAPLRSISGFSRLLEEDLAEALDDESRDLLGRIRRNARRMEEIISSLLSLARVSGASMNVVLFDAVPMIEEIMTILGEEREENPPTISLPEEMMVLADPPLFRQLLVNLLGNAWKFSAHRDDPRITVTTQETESGEITISIADNGAGFEPEQVGSIFEPFRRLHGEGEFKGTGVGLSIVKAIVQRHAGTIQAFSDGVSGARFTLQLPGVETSTDNEELNDG